MIAEREKISTGPNEEPINETIAGTGPGIADDALAPGEALDVGEVHSATPLVSATSSFVRRSRSARSAARARLTGLREP